MPEVVELYLIHQTYIPEFDEFGLYNITEKKQSIEDHKDILTKKIGVDCYIYVENDEGTHRIWTRKSDEEKIYNHLMQAIDKELKLTKKSVMIITNKAGYFFNQMDLAVEYRLWKKKKK